MMEASNAAASTSVKTVTFREYLSPTEPVFQTIYRSSCLDRPEGTAADDLRLGEVRRNTENSGDQLQNCFQKILHLQVEEATVATLQTEPSSTTDSSSFSLGFSMEENIIAYHGLSLRDCENLKCIALRMNSKGRLDKLISVYVKERKSLLNVHFRQFWDEKLSSTDIQRLEWNVMEKKIIRWIRAADYCFRRIFAYEKQLSNQIFKDLGNATADLCFVSTVTHSATQLFDFAEAVSSCRRSPERLRIVLLFYKRFSDIIPEINSIFESERGKSFQDHAGRLLHKFAQLVPTALLDFEDAVRCELSIDHKPGGTIHSLTRYVLDYIISLVVENHDILNDLVTTPPSISLGPLFCSELQWQTQTPLAAHLVWIITALKLNLEDKSKHYQDQSLSHLFMINNVHYIAQRIGQSEVLREMVGNDCIRKLTDDVEKSLTSYLSTTWNGLVYCLRNEGLHTSWGFTSGVSKRVLKTRFETFNAMFQGVLETHLISTVPDLELRSKLHQSILDKLIPSYRNFVETFGSQIQRGRYVLYSVEELEAIILGLFCYYEFL